MLTSDSVELPNALHGEGGVAHPRQQVRDPPRCDGELHEEEERRTRQEEEEGTSLLSFLSLTVAV